MRLINFIYIFNLLTLTQSEQFFGGTLSWKPTSSTNQSSIISILLTQTYQWERSRTNCNQLLIYNFLNTTSQNDTLKCVSKSNSCAEFHSQYWRNIQSSMYKNNSSKWSIDFCFNLTIRSNGKINSSPITGMISPIRIPIDTSQNITIPMIDADNDSLRCRWAQNRSTIDECGDICGMISGSSLDTNNCILTFNTTGKKIGQFYAVALMIEDFSNSSINTSLSSVPLQFLIEIINSSTCSSKPIISSNLIGSLAIQLGNQFIVNLTIQSGCSSTNIIDFYTISPANMLQTNLTRHATRHLWSITHTWIPTIEQIGPHIYCAVAIDNMNQQSDPYCLKLHVVSLGESLLPAEVIIDSKTVVRRASPSPKIVVVTVTVPYMEQSGYQFSSTDLALALGLGLPLTLAVLGLFICLCCCQHTAIYKSIFSRGNKTQTEITENQIESNTKSLNNINQKTKNLSDESIDYRQQYVNDSTEFQTKSNKTNRPLTQKNSSSDFEQTKTTFISPSTVTFTTNDVSFTRVHSLQNLTKSKGEGSILVREYNHQMFTLQK